MFNRYFIQTNVDCEALMGDVVGCHANAPDRDDG